MGGHGGGVFGVVVCGGVFVWCVLGLFVCLFVFWFAVNVLGLGESGDFAITIDAEN